MGRLADEVAALETENRELRAQLVQLQEELRPGFVQRTSHLMTLEEISEETGVAVATLRWWRTQDDGNGPKTFKIGRRVVAKRDDVFAWIETQRETR